MKVTKSIMSGLAVLAMAFVLVCSNANSGLAYRIPYPCGVQSPAYLDYTDARPAPCDRDQNVSAKDADKNHLSTGKNPSALKRTPEPMGSPGF
jgi:hypothetical protein